MNTHPKAKLTELIDSLEFQSEEYVTRFDRQTGQIVGVERFILRALEGSEDGDEIEEEKGDLLDDLPEWQKGELETAKAILADKVDRFIDPPDKFEFHEYRHMEKFIQSLDDPAAADQLWRAIKGRSAFRNFKDALYRLGIPDVWYRYRDEAMKRFVLEWAEANRVEIEDDTANPG